MVYHPLLISTLYSKIVFQLLYCLALVAVVFTIRRVGLIFANTEEPCSKGSADVYSTRPGTMRFRSVVAHETGLTHSAWNIFYTFLVFLNSVVSVRKNAY